MAITTQSFDNYNKQMSDIQAQLNRLQQPTYGAMTPALPVVHKVLPVKGIAGAEAYQKEMPPGSSDILAHESEQILYLVARDNNNVPLPITTMRYEIIEAKDDPSGFVTKKDFEDFKAELRELISQKGTER